MWRVWWTPGRFELPFWAFRAQFLPVKGRAPTFKELAEGQGIEPWRLLRLGGLALRCLTSRPPFREQLSSEVGLFIHQTRLRFQGLGRVRYLIT